MADQKTSEEYGAEGGKARAANLTKAELSEIGKQGALARWGKEVPSAQYGSPDRPLRIGDIEIACYVLADGRRVLTQRGLQHGVGFSRSAGKGGARRIAAFMDRLEAKGIDTKGLAVRANEPIQFTLPSGPRADGYEATILPDICAVVIDADQRGALTKSQRHIARQCAALQHGFATVGIVALVDEATGFQAVRARDALAKILEDFVQKELRKWVRTFPPEFYEQLCRLRGVPFPPARMRLPQYFGGLTNNIVYERLAPGVKDELKRVTARDPQGRHKEKLHQHLTENVGVARLREHLASVTTLMRISPNWDAFEGHLDKALPRWDDTLPLALGD